MATDKCARVKRVLDKLPKIITPHGGYNNLKSYQMSEIIYDATITFCNRFIPYRSRTHDQMVQAARSGKQNIAEGSMASGTSKKTELKLPFRPTIAAIGKRFFNQWGVYGKALLGEGGVKGVKSYTLFCIIFHVITYNYNHGKT